MGYPLVMARPVAEDPRATAVQLELLRASGTAGRAARARALTRSVVTLARRAIRERMPDASDDELGVRFVELHYGKALADGVREALARRRR